MEHLLALLHQLVSYPTVSCTSNRELLDWLSEQVETLGGRIRILKGTHPDRANILATLGPDAPGGLLLSGHTDVVPVDGQPGVTDPWTLTLKDGKYYGRGTCDMKAFYAIALAMVPEFKKAGLKRPIHFALSYDEEIGEANQFHRNLAEKQRLLEIGQQYRHHYCNAEDLSNKKNAAISKAWRQTLYHAFTNLERF